MKHRMDLDYTIAEGDLAPYFSALRAGQALASMCANCGTVCFPARSQCATCPDAPLTWRPLDGRATILMRTDGATGSFALVRFDGADTSSTVRLQNPHLTGRTGHVIAPVGDAAGLWLKIEETEGEDDER